MGIKDLLEPSQPCVNGLSLSHSWVSRVSTLGKPSQLKHGSDKKQPCLVGVQVISRGGKAQPPNRNKASWISPPNPDHGHPAKSSYG